MVRGGKAERCVSIWEMVAAVGDVVRRVWVRRVVWLVRSVRAPVWRGVGAVGEERRWAVHLVRSVV